MKKGRLNIVSTLSILSAILIHLALFLFLYIPAGNREFREDPSVFKLVDIDVYTPPPPPDSVVPPKRTIEPPPPPPRTLEPVPPLPEKTTEKVEETDTPVPPQQAPSSQPSTAPSPPAPLAPRRSEPEGIEYLPAHKISVPPRIPVDQVLRKIVYPPQANRQRIEGVVYLELYIDREGVIRKIEVLKDPGYGFAEAAVKAFEGVRCTPAEANGVPVAVRYRYPIRFKLR